LRAGIVEAGNSAIGLALRHSFLLLTVFYYPMLGEGRSQKILSRKDAAKTIPDKSQSYRVVALSENCISIDITIINEQFNIHYIQPLPTNKILLACARSHYRSSNNFEKNGRIYTVVTLLLFLAIGFCFMVAMTTEIPIIFLSLIRMENSNKSQAISL
jgi:hypothetical protein